MAKIERLVFNDYAREDAERQTASLAGLAVTLLVLVVCMWVLRELRHQSAIEDCLMASHTNCDILVTDAR